MRKFDSNDDVKRVLKTFYDHTQPVQALAFHPRSSLLAAGGLDNTVKMFDYQKLNYKRANKSLTESHAVNAIAFHPGGDYLLVGTAHSVLRLYDVNTLACFSSRNSREFHQGGVTGYTQFSYSIGASHFANQARTFSPPGREIFQYGEVGLRNYSSAAVFGPAEDFVMTGDDKNNSVVLWNSRTGERLKYFVGHQGPIRCLASSPNSPGFFSCSDDFRARFWAYKQEN
ncbi:hypothetical protein SARC_08427 [Sphaeroforma arctica JP610]|uniref:Cleavage stimulation factor 50 kDa subunit n=1 Tax=Sphaeroforma arctica JP610 TaxID=667725 RepID=A0A0L0FT78_9EUKA|nr:hypothetical protein SARC_08427 [Sphaeroforma arctica JP610]KNC79163.1 hypothetical protein SARC_08427 [Sphaeroforma arctica JP610]|eukprot:XP_014153065.1 hypothetical protein SARC_08427 [Sphaeroforma arctica JP610]